MPTVNETAKAQATDNLKYHVRRIWIMRRHPFGDRATVARLTAHHLTLAHANREALRDGRYGA